ncbi:V-type ATPase 116kDa subunit family protein [Embleya sp. NBC_00896]|uniref:V-type ATPase 116kDa subunit family protein n=1 Tax=Embleya sp. NBC_00896 TaxID=2975961 RepID=UPI002F9163E8|nr:ATPase [Embleya sp. NBC_00896]
MPRFDAAAPVRMQRVAVVAPRSRLRETLVRIAEIGRIELDRVEGGRARQVPAASRLGRLRRPPGMVTLSASRPDLDALEHDGRADLLAGEAELEAFADQAAGDGEAAALTGWCPASDVAEAATRVAEVGAAIVLLRAPRGHDPPTMLRDDGALRRSYAPLVRAYGTVPYADLDPTVPAGLAYAVMFGMMFGDLGHGALLLVAALCLRSGRPAALARSRALWPFVAGAAVASMLAGILYGEFFGPTGVVPALWLRPLDEPLRLLTAAVVIGVVLLAVAYVVAFVNRRREQGPGYAWYATSGGGGAALFAGCVLLAVALVSGGAVLLAVGGVLAVAGLVLSGVGLYAGTAGGPGGAAQAGVELVDSVMRLGSNIVSFTRLAAFGLTHAALGAIIWDGTTASARRGGAAWLAAVALFAVGNALAFALEALVAGVQAMRLEYYELFSRVFVSQGRPFRPWHPPVQRTEVAA